MSHPAIEKAKQIGKVAHEHGWKGSFNSEVLLGQRITTLHARRNGEAVMMAWTEKALDSASYSIMGRETKLTCARQVLGHIRGWPDLIKLVKRFPDNDFRVKLVEDYRRVPFDWREAKPSEILENLIGHEIHWYSTLSDKIYSDFVHVPKGRKKNKLEVKTIGNRRMLNFIGNQGFRSVMLDQIIQVG